MGLIERVQLLTEAEHHRMSGEIQRVHMELCRKDPIYWFDNFCWTFDPRREDDPHQPFELYPYQRWCIDEWQGNIEDQKDFGLEKSRDMGASWMLALLFQYNWIFHTGRNFLMGSRKEVEVDDNTENPSTHFGKLRYNLRHLPRWMRPEHIDKSLTLYNKDNGNLIKGESSNPSFGRGARYRAIFFDELAFWECAEQAYGLCSSTTNCRIVTSTPFGESNKFYHLMHDDRNIFRDVPDEFKPKGRDERGYIIQCNADGTVKG